MIQHQCKVCARRGAWAPDAVWPGPAPASLPTWRRLGRARRLLCLTGQGRKGTTAGLYKPIRALYLDDTALEFFNSSEHTCVDYTIDNQWWLGWTTVPIEEGLHQPDIFRAIEAATPNRSENGTHLNLPLLWRCCIQCFSWHSATAGWCYNTLHKCILQQAATVQVHTLYHNAGVGMTSKTKPPLRCSPLRAGMPASGPAGQGSRL
jgi:hypothetical protein